MSLGITSAAGSKAPANRESTGFAFTCAKERGNGGPRPLRIAQKQQTFTTLRSYRGAIEYVQIFFPVSSTVHYYFTMLLVQ